MENRALSLKIILLLKDPTQVARTFPLPNKSTSILWLSMQIIHNDFVVYVLCVCVCVCMHACAQSLQSCPTLCDPMDCSPLGSSVHGILQARILEWAAISSSSASS